MLRFSAWRPWALQPCQPTVVIEQFKDGPVMVDSGVRRGGDILKAIARGAKCAFLGCPFNYAAAVAGPAGLDHAISLLQQEVSRNMAMMGVTNLEQLNPGCLVRADHR